MTERQGVEIDYCPQCRGVWLDRGELDKIIERGGAPAQPVQHAPQYPERVHRDDSYGSYGHKKHRRENPLADLFDF